MSEREKAIRHVLWHMGEHHHVGLFEGGAIRPGSFVAALLTAMDRADVENMGKLLDGWPVLGSVYMIARTEGVAALQKLLLREVRRGAR